jgi:HlyD family secretion protein
MNAARRWPIAPSSRSNPCWRQKRCRRRPKRPSPSPSRTPTSPRRICAWMRPQILASSLQAPVLFTIAEDLRQMELRVDVDEADMRMVTVGAEATFCRRRASGPPIPGADRKIALRPPYHRRGGDLSGDPEHRKFSPVLAPRHDRDRRHRGAAADGHAADRQCRAQVHAPRSPSGRGDGRWRLAGAAAAAPPFGSARSAAGPQPRRRPHDLGADAGAAVAVDVTVGATDGLMTKVHAGDRAPGDRVITDMNKTR